MSGGWTPVGEMSDSHHRSLRGPSTREPTGGTEGRSSPVVTISGRVGPCVSPTVATTAGGSASTAGVTTDEDTPRLVETTTLVLTSNDRTEVLVVPRDRISEFILGTFS